VSETPTFAIYDDRVGLTKRQREILVKCRFHGVGPRELASKQDVSPGTVGNHLRRAEAKLEAAGYDGVVSA
jgi:DNA-binding CsgD family transcriptional regulator